MPSYIIKHQTRRDRRGGGVSIYIQNSLEFKERYDLSINNKDIESLTLQILSDMTRKTRALVIFSCRLPVRQYEQFENFLTIFFSQTKCCNKDIHIIGNFNLNLSDHDTNKNMQDFLNLIHQNGLVPTINKPTRVTMKTATAIDHSFTNSFVDTNFEQGIFKTDISGHYPIYLFFPSTQLMEEKILTAKENYQKKMAEKLDNPFAAPKAYWSILTNFLGKRKTPNIPPLIVNEFVVSDLTTKANIFNNFFALQCSPVITSSTLPNFCYKTQKRISGIEIKEDYTLLIIKNLNPNKARGLYNVSIRMIQLCG